MKKLFTAVLLTVAIGASAFANPNTVSTKVRNNFSIDFTGAENVKWKMGNNFVKATFILDEKEITAFYSLDGDMIGYSKNFNYNKLPKKALGTIAKKYPFPPYKLTECIEYTNAEGERNYFISFEESTKIEVVQISLNGEVSEFKQLLK